MNYTEIYNKIYDCLKCDNKENEEIHYNSVGITDAISELFRLSKQQNLQTAHAISEILNLMWNPLNLGEYNVDGKNQPTNFGTSATGLNNNK